MVSFKDFVFFTGTYLFIYFISELHRAGLTVSVNTVRYDSSKVQDGTDKISAWRGYIEDIARIKPAVHTQKKNETNNVIKYIPTYSSLRGSLVVRRTVSSYFSLAGGWSRRVLTVTRSITGVRSHASAAQRGMRKEASRPLCPYSG